MKIYTKIFGTFLITICLGLIIIIGLNTSSSNQFSNSMTDDTKNQVLSEELANLDRVAESNAAKIDEFFHQFVSELDILATFAEDLYNGRVFSDTNPSFPGISSFDSSINAPTDLIQGPLQNSEISFSGSAYFVPNVNSIDDLSAGDIAEIEFSSRMDTVFQSLFSTNQFYIWSSISLIDGLVRTFPYHNLDSWQNLEYTSSENNQQVIGVDPSHMRYFTQALDQGDRYLAGLSEKNFVIGRPITITIPNLVLQFSQAIYHDDGSVLGVVSTDVALLEVESNILGLTVLDTGYAYVLDNNQQIILHKDVTTNLDGVSLEGVEYDPMIEQDVNQFQSVLNTLETGSSGQHQYSKNEETWYISVYLISIPNFSMAVVLPEAEILAGSQAIENELFGIREEQLTLFIIISLIFSVIAFFSIKKVSDFIVNPITELTKVTNQIAEGNLQRTVKAESGSSRELVVLYETFSGLVTALRFGNEEYYAGNLNRAAQNYENALKLFTTMENRKGIGICHNNIGNIYNARNQLKDANYEYELAIDIARELLEHGSEVERVEHQVALASRLNNQAMLFKKINRFEEAIEILEQALYYDDLADNKQGYARRYGNMGQVYLEMDNLEKAKSTFYKAYELALELESPRAESYAKMNLGLLHIGTNERNKAKDYLLEAANLAENLDIRVVCSSLEQLKMIFEEEGNVELAYEIEMQLAQSKLLRVRSKNLIFVLDNSGSMSGRRTRDARSGIAKIYENQLSDNDYVGFLTFNNRVQKYIEARSKADLGSEFLSMINYIGRQQGGTALFDAIGFALNEISKTQVNYEPWVIVLTDGDDNWSGKYNPKKLSKLVQGLPDVNIVLIGVGDIRADRINLQKIADSATNGKFLAFHDGVENAILKAFDLVESMLADVEVEGFIPDY